MTEFENIMIFVSDALAYEHLPEEIIEKSQSKPIKTLAPSLHSPKSFASIMTGLEANKHNVNNFGDILEQKTFFDYFPNETFYDHDSSAIRMMLGSPDKKELSEIEAPFIWVERAMETHIPYNHMSHGNKLEISSEEQRKDKTNDELKELYLEGANSSIEHFFEHVNELKERGLYEKTLIIFTADRGEVFGKRKYLRKRTGHNAPSCTEIAQVPTLFYNCEVNSSHMRSVDIIPTAMSILKKEYNEVDGLNIKKFSKEKGICLTAEGFFNISYKWDGENWVVKTKTKALIEDIVPNKLKKLVKKCLKK